MITTARSTHSFVGRFLNAVAALSVAVVLVVFAADRAVGQGSRPPTPKPNSFRGPPVSSPRRPTPQEALRRAEIDRRIEETKRQWKAEADRAAALKPAAPKPRTAPPFDSAKALSPDDCFAAYVVAARGASSMDQVMGFLATSEQNSLRLEQFQFNPKQAAEEREWFHKNNPDVEKEALDQRYGSPYFRKMCYHQRFARDVIDVIGVRFEDSTAHLTVSTSRGGTSIHGKYLPYSKAHIEMVGEGAYWKVKNISTSALLYDEPPRVP